MRQGAEQSDPATAFLLRQRAASNRRKVDRVTAEVADALVAAGVAFRLLKGPTVASWLYPPESPRDYVDTDLLVPPAQMPAAEQCLRALGFRSALAEEDVQRVLGADRVWARASDGATVDLHSTLVGVGVSPQELWEAVSTEPVAFEVGGSTLQVWAPPARLLHVALHAAQHGARAAKPLQDLERAVDQVGPEQWAESASLARRVAATPAFAAGLRLVPQGELLAEELRLPDVRPADVVLRAGDPPPGALTVDAFAAAPGLMRKARIVTSKAVPSRRFMRVWMSAQGWRRGNLLLGYLYRPLWILARAVPAWHAWRAARATR